MASKSMASPAASSLFLVAMALMLLAASNHAEAARPPTRPRVPPAPAPTRSAPAPAPAVAAPAPAPGPSQGFCPAGFKNITEFVKAVPEYGDMGVLLSFSLYPPSSGLPGVVVGSRTCICYFPNIFAILHLGPLECVTASN